MEQIRFASLPTQPGFAAGGLVGACRGLLKACNQHRYQGAQGANGANAKGAEAKVKCPLRARDLT
jgi:hypothetical protein